LSSTFFLLYFDCIKILKRTFCNSDLQWAYLYHTFKNLSSGKFILQIFIEQLNYLYQVILKELFAIPICNGHTYTTLSKICQALKLPSAILEDLKIGIFEDQPFAILPFFSQPLIHDFERTFCNSDLQWAYLYHTFKNLSSPKIALGNFERFEDWRIGWLEV